VTETSRSHAAENLRNIAIVGHAGSGKTTLVEQLLAKAGAISAAGSIAKGTTVSDFSDVEKREGHSLDVSVCHLEHDGTFINLLDTPGYPDFLGRALAVLPAVETVAVVVNAERGVELVTQRVMDAAAQHGLCRLIIVNKIDSPDVDLAAVLAEIKSTFGAQCLPINLPAHGAKAVADCFFEPAKETPDFSSVAAAHTEITDQVVELDDKLMEIYLEQGEAITLEQLHDPFERALRGGHLIPVCFTSAQTGVGLRQLLRVFSKLMPNPFEGNPAEIYSGPERKPFKLDPEHADGHFVGHVFKLTVDPYIGRLATFRVHQGVVKTGDQVFVGEERKAVKLAHLYRLQGKTTREIPSAVAGDFCAVAKIDNIEFNDVLHASHDEDALLMPPPDLPEPMHAVAIELHQRGQEKKLSDALHKLAAEDPSLKIVFDPVVNQTVLRGMGELHLRLLLGRMREEFGIDVTTRAPRIAYRETVTRPADGHHRHKKQTGGAGQFGEVFLKIEPLPRGKGFEFVNKVVGGSIPGQYIPAVEKGVRQVLETGAVTGHPLHDLRVIVYDGKHHPVDSKEVAFVAAGKKAFLDAISKANPIVLEPIAKIEVSTPSQFVGDISGHLSGIRGRIVGSDSLPRNRTKILAQVPLAELNGFQTKLKSLTGGAGAFTLQLDHYETAPLTVQKALEKEFRPAVEE
jgi:elongation factor G